MDNMTYNTSLLVFKSSYGPSVHDLIDDVNNVCADPNKWKLTSCVKDKRGTLGVKSYWAIEFLDKNDGMVFALRYNHKWKQT